MPREKQTTTIDNDLYEMTLFGATQGYRLFHKLFQMFGPSFGRIVDAIGDGGVQDVNLSSDTAVAALRTLAESVKQSDLDHVIDALKKVTHVGVNGSANTVPLSGVFELHFSGRIMTMFKWVVWGLRVQYASFGDAFASITPPSGGDEFQAANSLSP